VISREQDLLFIDTQAMAPILDQGGLCVAFPQQVLAAVAVKTAFSVTQLDDACETLHSVRRVATYAGLGSPAWCGVLFFEGEGAVDNLCTNVGKRLESFEARAEQLANMRGLPDVVAIAGAAGFVVDCPDATTTVRGFRGDGMIVMLHSLLAHIARHRNSNA